MAFFGRDYAEYQRRVPIGIPFIAGPAPLPGAAAAPQPRGGQ